ncbi:MAG: YbbR-like domain-containing protein [Deltaproteobacteria bacterium]|nr:YbbR-like domain-containing protein [Deltaproteobacteria bacterium]
MRNFVLSNLKLKVFAVVFAAALWFFVAGQSKMEVGFFVPIGFKSIPKDLAMASTAPDEVEVRVSGPKLFVSNLSASQITAELDLSGAKEGTNSYRLTPADIVTPMGVEVLRLRPSAVELKMEKLVSADLRVRARVSGRAAAGYRVVDVIVFPRVVSVTGRQELKRLEAIYTKPVDVSGMDESASITAQLDISDHEIRSLSVNKVEVKVIIRKEGER